MVRIASPGGFLQDVFVAVSCKSATTDWEGFPSRGVSSYRALVRRLSRMGSEKNASSPIFFAISSMIPAK
jgi:hypothetical protein